jgi:hypothetical protein
VASLQTLDGAGNPDITNNNDSHTVSCANASVQAELLDTRMNAHSISPSVFNVPTMGSAVKQVATTHHSKTVNPITQNETIPSKGTVPTTSQFNAISSRDILPKSIATPSQQQQTFSKQATSATTVTPVPYSKQRNGSAPSSILMSHKHGNVTPATPSFKVAASASAVFSNDKEGSDDATLLETEAFEDDHLSFLACMRDIDDTKQSYSALLLDMNVAINEAHSDLVQIQADCIDDVIWMESLLKKADSLLLLPN